MADFASDVYAADIDSDGDLDVLSASSTDSRISWYENTATQSLEDFTSENGFRLFPNPVQNLLNIAINNSLLIEAYEIYNINGQAVGTGHNLSQEGIDVSNLASGLYILKLQTDKGTRSEKFIKM
ncbi:MAG: T9SS type A sorting domain-containing protein [Flavobacteriaceae bacterium]|nr:T9SS type A sorting domain-containing protein [Flavobacteriaceae bacterium]